MAACAFSSLCVGRQATARTRSLASQWSSSSSSTRPGVTTIRPHQTSGVSVGAFSTTANTSSVNVNPQSIETIPAAALQRVLASTASQNQKEGSAKTDSWDMSTMSSLFALAATGSVAMLTSDSYTSAEPASPPSPPSKRTVPSPRSAPFPMATSSKFAGAPSPFDMAFADSTGSDASPSTSKPNTRPKVQIRRTVRRRYGSAEGPFAVHDANNLPERFRFTKYDDAAECEGDAAAFIEDQKEEVVADDAKRYEVSYPWLRYFVSFLCS